MIEDTLRRFVISNLAVSLLILAVVLTLLWQATR